MSLILQKMQVKAETGYADDILDPLIEGAQNTFHIDFYTLISIGVVVIIILTIIIATTVLKKNFIRTI